MHACSLSIMVLFLALFTGLHLVTSPVGNKTEVLHVILSLHKVGGCYIPEITHLNDCYCCWSCVMLFVQRSCHHDEYAYETVFVQELIDHCGKIKYKVRSDLLFTGNQNCVSIYRLMPCKSYSIQKFILTLSAVVPLTEVVLPRPRSVFVVSHPIPASDYVSLFHDTHIGTLPDSHSYIERHDPYPETIP